MADLATELGTLMRSPILLVACDFDGTLAPIAPSPPEAVINPDAFKALHALADMPQTHVAILSGRSRADLAAKASWPKVTMLVGSHGTESFDAAPPPLTPHLAALKDRILRELRQIAAGDEMFLVEEKPASVAFHYRLASPESAAQALSAVRAGPARFEGVIAREGRQVIELSILPGDKGQALQAIRYRTAATGILFIGDDVTDEDGFACLGHRDLGVKVGQGPTNATVRVEDTDGVAELLTAAARDRAAWLGVQDATPINSYSCLSDQRTVMVLDPRGRVVWACLPRIDSPALFSEMLGGPSTGYFSVEPAGDGGPVRQAYAGDTCVLQTHWPTLTVTDYLDCSAGRAFQRAGRTDLIRVIEGRGRVQVRFAPRLDFGRVATRMHLRPLGLEVEGTPEPIVLFSPALTWRLEDDGLHHTAVTEFEASERPTVLELRYGTGNLRQSTLSEPERRRQTEHHWSAWVATLQLPEQWRDVLARSALALRSLCYRPTGAIVAAGTTSLPEQIGGVRNWDYRFCWPRDAALSASALVRLGSPGQALRFLDWLADVLEKSDAPEALRPIYTVAGGHLGPEAEIGELEGYRSSRPIRVGNAAAQQIQLDVFGPIVELLALLAQREASVTPEHWRLTEAMVAAVAKRWREPDHGIWEPRKPPRHHVYTKVMCWQTVERAQTVAEYFLGRRREDWDPLARSIAEDVLVHGWKPRVAAFTGTYEEDDLDAAALHVGLSGLLSPSDGRFAATVRAVEANLRDGPTVYRYRAEDGVAGIEGGFHLCTAWLIEAYIRLGRVKDAAALFDDMRRLVGATGLMSEQYDPRFGVALGNLPQAYSHVGLINAAVALSGTQG